MLPRVGVEAPTPTLTLEGTAGWRLPKVSAHNLLEALYEGTVTGPERPLTVKGSHFEVYFLVFPRPFLLISAPLPELS